MGIVALAPVQQLDVTGPATVFTVANAYREAKRRPYDVTLLSAGQELAVQSDAGIPLLAARRLADDGPRFDTLLVAGGSGARGGADDETLARLRAEAKRARRVGAVCTGAFILAQAGLLEGRRATTHWAFADELARRYPSISVDPEPIWVHDGVYTSAGITAGMDLALALVEQDHGVDVALAVARHLVLFLRRAGGQTQYSETLAAQHAERSTFRDLAVWISEHVREDLRVPALAERMGMSERNFARRFRDEVGVTPAQYVQRVRLDAARRRLEITDEPVEEVAEQCGFSDPDVFRRAFLAAFGVTPRDYRRRFSTAVAR